MSDVKSQQRCKGREQRPDTILKAVVATARVEMLLLEAWS